jgi:solute carrier family 5 (sodium-coupled monocarboxylate transporter), member 8/12
MENLSAIDYGVFVAMLTCCSAIGLYFGYKDLRRRSKKSLSGDSEALNYLMGGRQLMVFPVALSLIASLVSGVLLLGN